MLWVSVDLDDGGDRHAVGHRIDDSRQATFISVRTRCELDLDVVRGESFVREIVRMSAPRAGARQPRVEASTDRDDGGDREDLDPSCSKVAP
jgi:hypothetical protein